jgi:hypothetical protein
MAKLAWLITDNSMTIEAGIWAVLAQIQVESIGWIFPSQFTQQQRIQIFATDSNNNQFLD